MFTIDKLEFKDTPEKLQSKAEEIVMPVINILKELISLEEKTFEKYEFLGEEKVKKGIPKSQSTPEERHLFYDYESQYFEIVSKICTEDAMKRMGGISFGKPARYSYLNGECNVYFIMKSSKKAAKKLLLKLNIYGVL